MADKTEQKLRQDIEKKITRIFDRRKKQKKFIPGKTWIQYAGSVMDQKEINESVQTLLDGWFGLGKHSEEFENKLAEFVGVKGSMLTNSGSSANLLAVATLMSPLCADHLSAGDEVITAACGFPTTVNPLFFYGLKPVFVDVDPETYNLDPQYLEKALTKKTRMVMVAHTLGNPNDMDAIIAFCKKHKLYLIEDNCDALGSEWGGKRTGSFGHLATQSFYPPHHITMGEGGAIHYNQKRFERITRGLRDWGRSCWCRGDNKETFGECGVRFNYRVNGKPYDHKYLFNQIGFNLKPIEPQAAMGVHQLRRMPAFMKARARNFKRFLTHAKRWEKYFILPKSLPKANPCWFAFPLTIRDGVKIDRRDMSLYLESKMIQTRPLFGGNLIRQPAYFKANYRTVGDLPNADRVLYNTTFLGIYPGLGYEEIDFMAETIEEYLKKLR